MNMADACMGVRKSELFFMAGVKTAAFTVEVPH